MRAIENAMITAGVDMGAKTIKVVVLREGQVVGMAAGAAGLDAAGASREVMERALAEAGVAPGDLERVVATGVGRRHAPDANKIRTEVSCAALAASHCFPGARTVIDVGAEEGRVVSLDLRGAVADFVVNDRCAAGAGAFAEAMARALEVSLDELGPLGLQSQQAVPMNAQCVVFAESEVVSMIHSNVPRPDMARAVHDGIAGRVAAMVRRVGGEPPMVLMGGLARNVGFVDSLGRALELELSIPPDPQHSGALGAALAAARLVSKGAR